MLVDRLTATDPERDGTCPQVAARIRRMLDDDRDEIEEAAARIVFDVEMGRDEAVEDHTRRLDMGGREPPPMLVAPQELDAALELMPLDVVAGLQVAIANVAQVADASIGPDRVEVELPQGQRVTLRELPVRAAAVYAPGGRAAYPSTVVMGVVTARAAGVTDVCVCTPPARDGRAHPAILAACRLCGVQTVYRIGGAQAIAALAYGTETVNRVDVIVGPGNRYVQEAKRRVSHIVGIDGYAGPSDLLVVFGEDADVRLVALDLLAQAEHGRGTIVAAASSSRAALDALERELDASAAPYPTLEPDACALVEVDSPAQAIELANAFAPEHLELVGAAEEALAGKVRTAGCLLLGRYSATAFGDYVAGSNHVLPTGGAARFASTLSPRHFRRRMSVVQVSERAAAKLARAGGPIARAEGFPLHATSMEARMRENQRDDEAGAGGVEADDRTGNGPAKRRSEADD